MSEFKSDMKLAGPAGASEATVSRLSNKASQPDKLMISIRMSIEDWSLFRIESLDFGTFYQRQ